LYARTDCLNDGGRRRAELGAPLPAALPLLSEVSPELADESAPAISSSPSRFMGCKAGLHRMPVLHVHDSRRNRTANNDGGAVFLSK